MKKSLRLIKVLVFIVAAIGSYNVVGQMACGEGTHAVFAAPGTTKPVLLNKLGTKPQFGEIPKFTAASAYSHLTSVYDANVRNSAAELDSYLKALGYTGFKDPAFNVSRITPEIMKKGKTGWMGAFTTEHKYAWSVLGKDFETFRILSKSGACASYIMKKCGNAFYTSNCVPCTDCDPKNTDKKRCPNGIISNSLVGGANPVAVSTCKTQTLNFSGKGKINAGDVVNTTKNIPVIASLNGQTVCLGDYSVPVRLSYEMTANGEVNYAKTVQVCDFGAGVPANVNLNLPLSLMYKANGADVSVCDGAVNLMVDEAQFKALKAAYGTCTAPAAVSEVPSVATKTEAAPTSNIRNGMLELAKSVDGCAKQTLNITADGGDSQTVTKKGTSQVTIIGMYKKLGKLEKGESAEKYMCLGTYSVPTCSNVNYSVTNNTSLNHVIEVCDKGEAGIAASVDETVPVKLTSNFTKSDVTLGDYGKMYVALTKKQYTTLSKSFSRCCGGGNGSNSCK